MILCIAYSSPVLQYVICLHKVLEECCLERAAIFQESAMTRGNLHKDQVCLRKILCKWFDWCFLQSPQCADIPEAIMPCAYYKI